MKRKLLIVLLSAMVVFLVSGCVSSSGASKTTVEKYVDQRITGNWMLNADGYSGNDVFEYLTITFGENGKFSLEAKPYNEKEVEPISGKYSVDNNGNMYITKESGDEIKYYYTLQDGSMLLQFMENGTVKLKKVESMPQQPPVTEQPVEPTSVSIDLSAGNYTVGTDLPPGKYDVTAISGRGNFFGNPGIVNEILGVEGEYTIPSYKNAVFKNGNTIEVKGTLVVNLTSK